VEGGRVDDDRRLEDIERRARRSRVRDLELLVAQSGDVVRSEGLDEIAAELSRRPDDEDPLQNTLPMRRSVPSISCKSVIQEML
jgi:hypothetical protein